ncbi:MAG: FAD-dependent oxidoreductase [Deltaproteobacteria bacterium]|nr:FAD-dependent oxidoreductase [Deltaproteobacteria bacterium]
MTTTFLSRLFRPGKMGQLTLKNRVIMAPMGVEYADPDGYITQRQVDYYTERAIGGVGMVFVEASSVQPSIGKSFRQIHVDDDRYLPGLTKLSTAIKENGARAAIQLHHAGGAAHRMLTGVAPVAPSAVIRRGFEEPRALTREEIKEIRDCFVKAAVRCRTAGFEALGIHAAHMYLLAQFLSPMWNERSDEYGGSLENRARFLLEIVESIKEGVPELPVVIRLSAQDHGAVEFAGKVGITLDETLKLVQMLEKAGADALDMSNFGYGVESIKGMPIIPGELLHNTEAVKKEVSIPVIAVGSLTPLIAEAALDDGKADFIGIGRGLLADPYLVQKASMGSLEDITPCITCFQCQSEYVFMVPDSKGTRCSVNARTGKESLYPYPLEKASKPKRVLVIGAGPGGMECARVCALRGHEVVLLEKEPAMGGQLRVASLPPHKHRTALLIPYYATQLEKLKVDVRLGTEADQATVDEMRPDVVVVATGLIPNIPPIPGLATAGAHLAVEALEGKCEVGEKVVIIGGGLVGCETAEFLADQGKEITIVEMLPRIGANITPMTRPAVLGRLRKKGVQMLPGATCKEVSRNQVIVTDKAGQTLTLATDTVLMATGGKPNRALYEVLQDKVFEIHLIGDAVEPRRIMDAVHEGFIKGYSI